MKKSNTYYAQWVLRIATAGTFLGHGAFALQGNESWFEYFYAFGITGDSTITSLLFLIGLIDVTFAIVILVRPIRGILLWMAIWAMWTALLRWPIGSEPVWEFIEQSANWGSPLALLLLLGWPKNIKDWLK